MPIASRRDGQRDILAPARRACGLASNEVEEALDRMMLEPGGWREWGDAKEGEGHAKEQAPRFATYLRRLTQSATTVAMLGQGNKGSVRRLESLAERLESLAQSLALKQALLEEEQAIAVPLIVDVIEDQMQRMERQVFVLERAAALAGVRAVPGAAEAVVMG